MSRPFSSDTLDGRTLTPGLMAYTVAYQVWSLDGWVIGSKTVDATSQTAAENEVLAWLVSSYKECKGYLYHSVEVKLAEVS